MDKISYIRSLKNREKITAIAAYTYPEAKLIDEFCDLILVGDSLAMTIYGHENTAEIGLEPMILHACAVKKGSEASQNNALIAVDIPAKTFEESPDQALKTAQEIMKRSKCDAVKIETTENEIATIETLVKAGIPTIGHVGLLPQSVKEKSEYRYQGKTEEEGVRIIALAKKIEKAGAFAIVIEAVPEKLGAAVTNSVQIPVIGIGASKKCDGQILVIDDILGLNTDFKPRFVKNYENLAAKIQEAVKNYNFEVKSGIFPEKANLLEK